MTTISEVVNSCDVASIADRIIGARTGQSGHNITYDCPRHKSVSRKSFSVNQDKQLFFCHGCGVGGDVLSMVEFVRFGACGKKLDSASRRIALEELAQIAGINLEPVSEEYQRNRAEQNIVFECLAQLKDWWKDNLINRPDVQAWITEQWGFTPEEQAALELGYAPEDNNKLRDIVDPTIRTGAYIKAGKDKMLPLFQGRVIFPYMQRGICVYAIGRKTPWTPDSKYEDSKYKKMLTCSDNHPYVGKCVRNDCLYNYTAIYSSGPIIITEGTADCARLSLAGFSAISPGTTTIPAHTYSKIIKQLSGKEVIILNDNDQAGKAGSVKMAADFAERGIKVKIASFPESEEKIDVCSFFQSGGTPEDIERIIKAAKTAGNNEIYNTTDMGNALRFAAIAPEIGVKYGCGNWYAWQGKKWSIDELGVFERFQKNVIPAIKEEAKIAYKEGKEDKGKALLKWATKSESTATANAALTNARSKSGIRVDDSENFDSNPNLFNIENGTIDTRTGAIKPHNSKDLITRFAPVNYRPESPASLWIYFLNQIMGDDQEMVSFLQRAIGYSLTGLTHEHVCFFCFGLGANGKSVFLNAILNIMGDYGMQAAPDLLLQSKSGNSKHPSEQADLMGRRFVVVQECNQGSRLAESTLKQITSGDKIKARYMHKDFFEFTPTHKIWIAANHKPIIRDNTNSIWRRIIMIPFEVTIPVSKQDKNLPEKLFAEREGILSWAVQGCLEYQRIGLKPPQRTIEATKEYRDSSDPVKNFLEASCFVVPNVKSTVRALYGEYKQYCEYEDETLLGKRTFGEALIAQGFKRVRDSVGDWCYSGIKLKSVASQDELAAAKNVLQFPVQEREIDFNDSEVEQENERE